jgi:hypothetical protein
MRVITGKNKGVRQTDWLFLFVYNWGSCNFFTSSPYLFIGNRYYFLFIKHYLIP